MKKIKNYCLYYLPKSSGELGDTLMVFFGENKLINKRNLTDNLITLYHDEEIVGYVILNVSNLCKIKANGTIYLPNDILIQIINDFLARNAEGIELEKKTESGFVVGRILEQEKHDKSFIYKVDIVSSVVEVESTFDIPLKTLVVIAKNYTYLLPGRMVNEYVSKDGRKLGNRICTYDDLQMEVSYPYVPLLILEDSIKEGQDFFLMEEKLDA